VGHNRGFSAIIWIAECNRKDEDYHTRDRDESDIMMDGDHNITDQ
jgi:hypothetical protein